MKRYFGQNTSLIVLIALLLPLFYVNVKSSHEWGDDFAQYFIQARNILEHKPQTDNGLVFDRQTGEYALQAYPVGFPLILSGAWFLFGDSIYIGMQVISLFFFALGIACFFYFRKYFSEVISILLALMIIYNPLMISFKKQILSDVPFSFFFLLGVLLFQSGKKNISHLILTGVVWGFALSVRGIGATLFIAAGFFLAQKMVMPVSAKNEEKHFQPGFRRIAIVFLCAFGFYFLLNAILFPVPSGGILAFYAAAIRGEKVGTWMLLNLDYYYQVFLNFFATMGGNFQWLSTATKYILLALILPGIFLAFVQKPRFKDWVCLTYILVLFIYPYLGGGFRFILPVMPFLAHYIFAAFYKFFEILKADAKKPALIFLCIILIQYTPGLIDQVHSMNVQEAGPQERPAVEAFDYVSHLPADALVVFVKPRALSFYSGRRTTYVTRQTKADQLEEIFTRLNAHYFLVCTENTQVEDVLLKQFIEDHSGEIKRIYQNVTFSLYTDLK